jgi:hypothetical protein
LEQVVLLLLLPLYLHMGQLWLLWPLDLQLIGWS